MTRRAAIVALAIAWGTSPALAQTRPAPDEDPYADVEVPLEYAEVIEIWDERPKKPFDRDTELRLTGEQLAERGVTDLAQALELVPELHVRAQGRGGIQVNIRGGRRGAVKVLIDGVPVDEPFYGTFDVSSIPVTDIAQIRVSLSPASPIDGAGGPAGVIEVHTRDAVGARMLRARAQASDLPSAEMSVTGRSHLTDTLAVRSSAQATAGMREFAMEGADVDEARRAATGALRLEYRDGGTRVAADAFLQHRSFVVPPGEDGQSDILVIDGETSARAGLLADTELGDWRLRGRAYTQQLSRESTYYRDVALTEAARGELVDVNRSGAGVLVNRPYDHRLHFVLSANLDSEDADVEDLTGAGDGGGRSTISELAAGVQVEQGMVRIDAAAGAAIPLGIGDAPWAEGKLAVAVTPAQPLTLEATLARKGRVPTLRELYRLDIGNQELDPEVANFGELRATVRPASWLEASLASWIRDTDGMIRFDGERSMLINLDGLVMRGFDASVEVDPVPLARLGASAQFIDARDETFGSDPLDFLPRWRAEAWWQPQLSARASARVRVRHTGEQLDRGEALPGYTTLDISAFGKLTESLHATLRVDNLADERFELRSGGVTAPGRIFTLSLLGVWE